MGGLTAVNSEEAFGERGRVATSSRPGIESCSPASTAAPPWAVTEARLRRGQEPQWETEPLDVEDAITQYLS